MNAMRPLNPIEHLVLKSVATATAIVAPAALMEITGIRERVTNSLAELVGQPPEVGNLIAGVGLMILGTILMLSAVRSRQRVNNLPSR